MDDGVTGVTGVTTSDLQVQEQGDPGISLDAVLEDTMMDRPVSFEVNPGMQLERPVSLDTGLTLDNTIHLEAMSFSAAKTELGSVGDINIALAHPMAAHNQPTFVYSNTLGHSRQMTNEQSNVCKVREILKKSLTKRNVSANISNQLRPLTI